MADRDDAPLDPDAVRSAYARHRAARRARVERRRRARRADIRFWLVLLAIVVGAALLTVAAYREIQDLFGI